MDNNKIDKIIQKLIEHDHKINELATKTEFKEANQKVLDTLEDIATKVKRIDEDRVFTGQWVRRIEDKVEAHEKTLQRIISQLNIA